MNNDNKNSSSSKSEFDRNPQIDRKTFRDESQPRKFKHASPASLSASTSQQRQRHQQQQGRNKVPMTSQEADETKCTFCPNPVTADGKAFGIILSRDSTLPPQIQAAMAKYSKYTLCPKCVNQQQHAGSIVKYFSKLLEQGKITV